MVILAKAVSSMLNQWMVFQLAVSKKHNTRDAADRILAALPTAKEPNPPDAFD